MTYKEYTLSGAAVDEISVGVQSYLNEIRMDKRNVQRVRLTVEELLLNIKEGSDKNIKITVGLGKQFGRHILRLRYEMEPFDPIKSSENPWVDDMMRSLGVYPSWSHRGKTNTVSLVLADRPKRSGLFYIALAVIAAAALGVAGRFFSETLRQSLNETVLTPIYDGFLGLLNTFAGLTIFLIICNGILGMGDAETLGRTGKAVLLRFFRGSLLISVASTVMILPFLNLDFSGGALGDASALGQLSQMLFDMLPTNIVDPFRNGNIVQIVVIALFIGGSLLIIGERGSHLRSLVSESTALMQRAISSVCVLVPVFIFASVLQILWFGEAATLLTIIKPLIVITASMTAIAAALWLIASLRLKCSPILLLKKVMPAFLVAFTTASSLSAMPLGMETCEKKLGVRGSMVSFAYPLGAMTYKASALVYFIALALNMAEIYQVGISVPWLFMAVIMAILCTIAMPPVPGGDILCYSLLFSILGFPADAMLIATALGRIIDYLDTGFNVMSLILETACEAGRLDSLDRTVLLNRKIGT